MYLQSYGEAAASLKLGTMAELCLTDQTCLTGLTGLTGAADSRGTAEERLTAHQWAARALGLTKTLKATAGAESVTRERGNESHAEVSAGKLPDSSRGQNGYRERDNAAEKAVTCVEDGALRVQASAEAEGFRARGDAEPGSQRRSAVQRLLRERDALVATGMYHQRDMLISELDRRASELMLHERDDVMHRV